jgi:D-alanyl-D-alanine carboxypeptidase
MRLFAASAALAALLACVGVAQAAFRASVKPIPADVRTHMIGTSWHRGCPVALRDLRLVTLTFHRFDWTDHLGRLVVHRRQAQHTVTAMHKLYDAGFRIRRMRLVDAYGANDDRSMRHNNTSAFNCRDVAGTSSWSMHAYGRAIDINPVQNPYVSGGHVSPAAGVPYADRDQSRRGMIHGGDAVVRAFSSVGWGWGGYWTGSTKDYQHFSTNGH